MNNALSKLLLGFMQTTKAQLSLYSLYITGRLIKLLVDSDSTSSQAGPSCSKLTTSLVNNSLKFTSSDTQIC